MIRSPSDRSPGSHRAHRVVETEVSLGRELQHDRRDERLGDAPHAKAVARTELRLGVDVRDADSRPLGAVPVAHEHECTGRPARDDRLQARRESRRAAASEDDEQREREAERHGRSGDDDGVQVRRGDRVAARGGAVEQRAPRSHRLVRVGIGPTPPVGA